MHLASPEQRPAAGFVGRWGSNQPSQGRATRWVGGWGSKQAPLGQIPPSVPPSLPPSRPNRSNSLHSPITARARIAGGKEVRVEERKPTGFVYHRPAPRAGRVDVGVRVTPPTRPGPASVRPSVRPSVRASDSRCTRGPSRGTAAPGPTALRSP